MRYLLPLMLLSLLASPALADELDGTGEQPVRYNFRIANPGESVTGPHIAQVTGPPTAVYADGASWVAPANTLPADASGARLSMPHTPLIRNNQRTSLDNTVGGPLTASWVKRGEVAIAPGCVAAPDGSCTAEEVTFAGGAENDITYTIRDLPLNSALNFSIWIRLESAPEGSMGRVFITNSGVGSGRAVLTMSYVPAGEWRKFDSINTRLPGIGLTTPWSNGASSELPVRIYAFASGEPLKLHVWRPWMVVGGLTPDAEVGAVLAPIAGNSFILNLPPQDPKHIAYTFNNERRLVTPYAGMTEFSFGPGMDVEESGALKEVVFCTNPNPDDCR